MGVPGEVRHHNRLVDEWDDDLGQWVADECVRLERDLREHKNKNAAAGHLYSGSMLTEAAHLKENFLHAYRDQERAALRHRDALKVSEGLRHRLWRSIARKGGLPDLQSPDLVNDILDRWRDPIEFQGATSPVSDPTRRSLDWAIDKYGKTGFPL